MLKSLRIFEDFCGGIPLSRSQIISILPERQDFALLYTFLRRNGGYAFPTETLAHRLDNRLTYGKIRVILEALSELGLIEICEGIKQNEITLRDSTKKVDLESAKIIRQLREASR